MTNTASDQYLLAHITEALATDERTHALDVRVHISAGEVVLSGTVSCPSRRAATEEVIRSLLPRHRHVVNDIRVQDFMEPSTSEPVDE